MKRGTPDHPKTHDLAAALDLEPWGAVGILESIWHFTGRYCPRGDIGRWTDQRIATGIGWTRDAAKLVRALVHCGWIDTDSEHRLLIHDWHDHADEATRKYLKRNKLSFLTKSRRRRDIVRTVSGPPLPLPLPLSEPLPEPEPSLAGPHVSPPASPGDFEPVVEVNRYGEPGEAEALRRQIDERIKARCARGRQTYDVVLAKASKTPRGRVITNLAGIAAVDWLRTTLDRLIEMDLADRVDAEPRASPPRMAPATQATVAAVQAVADRERERRRQS